MSKVLTHKTINNVAVEQIGVAGSMVVYKQIKSDDYSYLFFTKNSEVLFTMEIRVDCYQNSACVEDVIFKDGRL